MPSVKLIDIAGEIITETEKASLFYDGRIKVWIPKSQCQWDQDDKTLTMEEWLTKDKELV